MNVSDFNKRNYGFFSAIVLYYFFSLKIQLKLVICIFCLSQLMLGANAKQLISIKQFYSSFIFEELLLFLNCRKAENFMDQDKEKLHWERFFPTWELRMVLMPCSQRQRCSGFSGQLKPLSYFRSSLVFLWMWVTEGKRYNDFQGPSLASRIWWSSKNCNMA